MEGKRQEKEVTEESRAEGDLEEKNEVERQQEGTGSQDVRYFT